MINKLALAAAEYYIKEKKILPLPAVVPGELRMQRACYVAVYAKPGRRLVAMHGEPLPRQRTLAEEIIINTTYAVHSRVRRTDLPSLKFIVTVLSQLQRVTDSAALDPQRYGLYVRSVSGKTAVLLPGRVGVETSDDQLATAFREADITARTETATLYRFAITEYE